MPSQGSTSIMWVRLLRNALLLIVTRGTFLVASMPHFFCSFSKENRAQMMPSLLFFSLDLAALKRHLFVTKTSDCYALDYILRFKDGEKRTVRLPAPLVF